MTVTPWNPDTRPPFRSLTMCCWAGGYFFLHRKPGSTHFDPRRQRPRSAAIRRRACAEQAPAAPAAPLLCLCHASYRSQRRLDAGDLPLTPWDANGPRKGTKASDSEVATADALGTREWEELVPMSPLAPGYADCCRHWFAVSSPQKVTHLRINYWPDGGVARLRCYGRVQKDWSTYQGGQLVDLAATVPPPPPPPSLPY